MWACVCVCDAVYMEAVGRSIASACIYKQCDIQEGVTMRLMDKLEELEEDAY